MASMNDTVKKFIKNQAALSTLYPSRSSGVAESFPRRPHSSRDLLGECLSGSSFPEKAKKRLMQSVGFQFPSRALLHQWGKEDSPNCPSCRERESLGHIFLATHVMRGMNTNGQSLLQFLQSNTRSLQFGKYSTPKVSSPPMGRWRVRYSSSSPNAQLQPSRMPVISRAVPSAVNT
jgi:hypothetical protein